MTGKLISKKTSAGNEFYYIHLVYKDPMLGTWKTKDVKTGLPKSGNKRKANAMIGDCIEKYAYLERSIESGIDPDIELCDFLDIWLENKSCEICQNTCDSYRYYIKTIKRYFSGRHTKVRDVTPKNIDDFYHYCLRCGKISKKGNHQQPLSVRTVRSIKNVLYSTFNLAVLDGIVSTNPVRDTRVSNKKNSDFSEEMLFLDEDEIRDVLVYLDEHVPFLKPIAFIGIYYGLRREEILGLKWSAIDFKRKTLSIRHTVTGNKTIYAEDKTKTRSGYRTLALFPTAEDCLMQVKRQQEENREFFGNTYHDTHDYVFTHDDGTPYRPDYLTSKFAAAMKAYGRPEITLHKLRYTCVSLLLDKGWDVKKIQYWIGDNDAATVMNVYAQYVRFKSNVAENDLTAMTESVADLFR